MADAQPADVPICRAAFGALERVYCGALYPAMDKRPIEGSSSHQRRVRRWAREIALAALLTVAAVAFITAAWLRGSSSQHLPPALEAARKPAN